MKAWAGASHIVPDTSTRSCLTRCYHGKRMRPLLGWEHFKIQMGLSSEAAMEEYAPQHAEFSDPFYKKAAGNAFSNDALATVVIAIWGSVRPAEMSGLVAVRAARLWERVFRVQS